MSRRLIPRFRIGEHDVSHFVVALEHTDGTLEKGVSE
jgi:hypothetical protein